MINTCMNSKTKTLLEELVELAPSQDTSLVIEARGSHIIASAIKLIETVQENYGQELAEDLEKRLLSSIRNRNSGKFVRATKSLDDKSHPKSE